jgi:hypothetical protein
MDKALGVAAAVAHQLADTLPLTPDDIAGILGLRYAKFRIPPNQAGKTWVMRYVLERPGQPAHELLKYLIKEPREEPFLTACYLLPAPGQGDLTFIQAHQWFVTGTISVPNPGAHVRQLRAPSPPVLKPGRTVLMVWWNQGQHGWDPGDMDFVQRIVVDLSV